jgi:hypothetical protein
MGRCGVHGGKPAGRPNLPVSDEAGAWHPTATPPATGEQPEPTQVLRARRLPVASGRDLPVACGRPCSVTVLVAAATWTWAAGPRRSTISIEPDPSREPDPSGFFRRGKADSDLRLTRPGVSLGSPTPTEQPGPGPRAPAPGQRRRARSASSAAGIEQRQPLAAPHLVGGHPNLKFGPLNLKFGPLAI